MKFKIVTCSFFILLMISCKKNQEKEEKEPFEMYQTSELAALMAEMYQYNDSLKTQIVNGETLNPLPANFRNIHTAEMTERFERDENFLHFAKVIETQQNKIYTTSKDSIELVYNSKIQSCIACHQTSCTGPIPRIEKLLIQ